MKLKQIRKQKGITQEQLAKKLYVNRCSIHRWETGKALPIVDMLPKIAQALGCKMEDLF